MIVKPIKLVQSDESYLPLTLGREYEVLGIEADMYRILTDENATWAQNNPVLFEAECFEIIDPTEPDFWICEFDDGERYCGPPEWQVPRYYEDYHDGVRQVVEQFIQDLKRYYPRTWNERFGNNAL